MMIFEKYHENISLGHFVSDDKEYLNFQKKKQKTIIIIQLTHPS